MLNISPGPDGKDDGKDDDDKLRFVFEFRFKVSRSKAGLEYERRCGEGEGSRDKEQLIFLNPLFLTVMKFCDHHADVVVAVSKRRMTVKFIVFQIWVVGNLLEFSWSELGPISIKISIY